MLYLSVVDCWLLIVVFRLIRLLSAIRLDSIRILTILHVQLRKFWGVVVHWDACRAYMKRRETISIFTNSCPVEIHLIEDFASFK